jgi:transcriptional regulator of acetoin/glycerol metabolism
MNDALHETEGNVTAAAKRLGVDRSTLWRKMKRRPSA